MHMSKDDDLSPIPSIKASREGGTPAAGVPRPRGRSRSTAKADSGGKPGLLLRFTLIVALLVAIAACAWSWQLQETLTQTSHLLDRYEKRIGDLEDRLADTDEGMNQNATLQAAKIRELDSEVRKLWDNVWKSTKERLGKLEATAKRSDGSIAANADSVQKTQADLGRALQDITRLQKVSGDLERMAVSARSSQAEVERVADALNAIDLELAKLSKRVGGNEEWIGAINAFRQSTNASISQLQSQLRALQTPGVGG
jgi:chromosome segregation ATPase